MTYTAIRHKTKSGKSSRNYNVVDSNGFIIGCCTSRKSALTLSERLTEYELQQISNQLQQQPNFTDSLRDGDSPELSGCIREIPLRELTTICKNGDTTGVPRFDESDRWVCDVIIDRTPEGVDTETIRRRTETELNSSSSTTKDSVVECGADAAILCNRLGQQGLDDIARLKECLHNVLTKTATFTENCFGLASDSRQLASDSRQLASDSRQLASDSRQLASDSRQLASDSRQLASDSLRTAQNCLHIASGAVSLLEPSDRGCTKQIIEQCIDIEFSEIL